MATMLITSKRLSESAPPATLAEKLTGWIRRVPLYDSPPYQEFLLQQHPVAEALSRLPFISKSELRSKFPYNFLGEGADLEQLVEDNLLEVEYTSGTSEERSALLLGYGWWNQQEALALRTNRRVAQILDEFPDARRVTINSPVCSSDICYTTMPAHRERVIGNNLFVSLSRHPFLWSEAELERMAAETLAWQPVFLDLDPVYGVVFAQFCERRGIKLPSVRFILCSYEFVSVAHRRILQRVFGAPIFNLYGSTETGHLLMENERGEMIPSAQTAFLEVIQPDAHGIGELVGTTLTNEYMPLIRYRIGDLVETHALTEQTTYTLHGRKKDAFIRSDGARITTLQIDRLFSGLEGITHYQLLELKGNDWQLRFVPEGGGPDGAALAGLQKRLAEMLQITGKLEGQPADLLMPEGSGKFRLGYPLRQAAE